MTIEQAKKNSASFLYLWASDEFLAAIPNKYARIIRTKRANQNRLITASFGEKNRDARIQEIRAQFIEDYGMTPAEALVTLAQGGSVAGKNWKEGVYGIGAVSTTFAITDIDDKKITVDKSTGHIYLGAEDITDTSKTVYKTINGKTVEYQLFSDDEKSYPFIFMSQYNKTLKKYGAQSYSDNTGTVFTASGKEKTASDSADIWGEINLALNEVLDWILKLLKIEDNDTKTLTAKDTLPSQKGDGFVTSTGFGDAGVVMLALAAGGAFLAGGFKGLKKSKKSK